TRRRGFAGAAPNYDGNSLQRRLWRRQVRFTEGGRTRSTEAVKNFWQKAQQDRALQAKLTAIGPTQGPASSYRCGGQGGCRIGLRLYSPGRKGGDAPCPQRPKFFMRRDCNPSANSTPSK